MCGRCSPNSELNRHVSVSAARFDLGAARAGSYAPEGRRRNEEVSGKIFSSPLRKRRGGEDAARFSSSSRPQLRDGPLLLPSLSLKEGGEDVPLLPAVAPYASHVSFPPLRKRPGRRRSRADGFADIDDVGLLIMSVQPCRRGGAATRDARAAARRAPVRQLQNEARATEPRSRQRHARGSMSRGALRGAPMTSQDNAKVDGPAARGTKGWA
jgi:hypothetical protein